MKTVCQKLNITKRKYRRLKARITRNDSTTKMKISGKTSVIKDSHIEFLMRWFDDEANVGKSFK